MSRHVVSFDEHVDDDVQIVGGKCASLGAMTAAGLPVPTGFSVTTMAFRDSMERNGVPPRINAVLAGVDVHDLHALAEAGEAARRLVMDSGPDSQVEARIRAGYARLCDEAGVADLPVAVRSSANAEDQPDASFAGQQDTYLWVRGSDNVVFHVVRCWASLYTDRAIAYRVEHGYPHAEAAMAVAVQKMVQPLTAGVAFTLDPTNGDRSKVVIDASWGLGEAVVGGYVTPDNFVVDKVIFEIVRRQISAKETEVIVVDDEVHHHTLDPDRSTAPSLTDDQVKAVARMARLVEKHFGRPQDVEWALDPHTGNGIPAVVLLQSRPETVWSNKSRPLVSHGVGSPLDGIVNTLLSPIRVKPKS